MDQCSNRHKNILVIKNYQCLWHSDMKKRIKINSMIWSGCTKTKMQKITTRCSSIYYTIVHRMTSNVVYWGTCRMCCCCSSAGCLRGAAPCTIARCTSLITAHPAYLSRNNDIEGTGQCFGSVTFLLRIRIRNYWLINPDPDSVPDHAFLSVADNMPTINIFFFKFFLPYYFWRYCRDRK